MVLDSSDNFCVCVSLQVPPTYLASVLQTSVSCLSLLLLQVLGPRHLRRPSCPPDWIPAAAPPQPALPLPQFRFAHGTHPGPGSWSLPFSMYCPLLAQSPAQTSHAGTLSEHMGKERTGTSSKQTPGSS